MTEAGSAWYPSAMPPQGVPVLEPDSLGDLREHLARRLAEDRSLGDQLRADIRSLRSDTMSAAGNCAPKSIRCPRALDQANVSGPI